ncbi:MAG: ATP-binding protein [Phycisphaerae bacterium]
MSVPDFEKLGAFYLGKVYDLAARQRRDELVLYDSKDLVTHAVCVGMTGSGKTGLCLSLLEEAAIDHIPALVIDPKGDLANLLLTFPELRPEDFAPWINEDDARRKGVEPAVFAGQQAELWRRGLAEWGQDGERIRKLREAADFAIYTPGSSAGLPVSVLRSFAAPPIEIVEDRELFQERIASLVTSLLGLLNLAADPLQSREHILLSTILAHAWNERRDVDLAALIHGIQTPPVARVGVMEVETFFPANERFALAMQLNNLIASPGFSRWLDGAPLDIQSLLYTGQGRPRVSIFSIAHLSDAERMFFVSLLLNQVLGWVRTQSGTTSLRALLYMDEIAGYFPPVANPPSKLPLLTLMKQARAFGFGVVLATQNPVDLDYKGLANAGTWFIGRLQTERDKARVLDGLEGATAGASARFDRAACDQMLSQLGTRVFLMNNVHDDGPAVFETRWAMSYLRGPLTRTQIKSLTVARPETARDAFPALPQAAPPPVLAAGGTSTNAAVPAPAAAIAVPAPAARPAPGAIAGASTGGSRRPVLPPDVAQFFIPARARGAGEVLYRPLLLGCAKVYFADAKLGVQCDQAALYVATISNGPVAVDWDHAERTTLTEQDVEHEPLPAARFDPLPADAGKPKAYEAWKKSFAAMLYRNERLELYKSPAFRLSSKAGESERDFRLRLMQAAREARDAQLERLRGKYAPKFAALQERIRKAEQQIVVQQAQASQAKAATAVSFGSAILGALLGRKVASVGNVGRASTAARSVGRSMREAGDVGRAQENAQALREQLAALEAAFEDDARTLGGPADPMHEELDRIGVKPKKSDIAVRTVVLVWAPHDVTTGGEPVPLWQ